MITSCSLNDPKDIKYSLADNMKKRLSFYRLLARQMHSYWVERSIKDSKNELSMGQHQVHSWQALEHHLAMTDGSGIPSQTAYRQAPPVTTAFSRRPLGYFLSSFAIENHR